MAYTQFKGIKRVLASNTAYNSAANHGDYLYFVRESASATEGDIWFQGIHYGHFGEHDLDVLNAALDGFLGETTATTTNVKDYIDEKIAELSSGMTTSVAVADGSFSGLTITDDSSTPEVKDYKVLLTNVAPADELAAEIEAREDAEEAINAELDAVEGSLGFNGTAYTNSGNYISGDTVAEDISRLDTVLGNLNNNLGDLQDELQTTAETLSQMIADEEDAREAAIEALDYSGVTANGQAIVNVTETNGVITATQGDIAAEHVTIEDEDDHFTATNVEDALAELAAKVSSNEVEIEKLDTPCGNTYASSYILKDAEGNQLGDAINVAKDQFLKEAYLSGQTLYLVMYTQSGDTTTIEVDFSEMIIEAEAGEGLYMGNDHSLNVGKDANSEDFLVITADAIGITGVTAAIEAAVAAEAEAREDADDEIMSALTSTAQTLVEMIENAASAATTEVVEGEDNEHLSISASTEADGHKKYTVTLTDVASDSALTQEISDREDADAALQAEIDAVEASVGLTTAGTWVAGSGEHTSASTSVANAIDLLDAAISESNSNWEQALAEEIANRESGDTVEATAREAADEALEAAIEAEATARTQVDQELDARLDAIEESYITAITVNGVDATVANNAADVTIDAGDVEIGKELTGTTGGIHFDSSATTDNVLQDIVDVLNQSVAGSYTGLTSSDSSLTLTGQTNGQDIVINKQAPSESKALDGHLFLEQDSEDNNKVFASMYWIDEEE